MSDLNEIRSVIWDIKYTKYRPIMHSYYVPSAKYALWTMFTSAHIKMEFLCVQISNSRKLGLKTRATFESQKIRQSADKRCFIKYARLHFIYNETQRLVLGVHYGLILLHRVPFLKVYSVECGFSSLLCNSIPFHLHSATDRMTAK
jgi:hypothetical protein